MTSQALGQVLRYMALQDLPRDFALIIRQLIRIAYFYSDLAGGSIPDDDSNVALTYDWHSVFRKQ